MSARRRGRGDAGFTLVELLISTCIVVAVLGGLFAVVNPAEGTFQAQPEVSDMQQRLRVAVDALSADLIMAGAGISSVPGGAPAGPLSSYFAPVMPYRTGALNPDPPGTFKTDTISVLYVPETCAQTTLAAALPPGTGVLGVNDEPGCPRSRPLCGFEQGTHVVIFDATGAVDTGEVTDARGPAGQVQRYGPDSDHVYAPGAIIAEATSRTYYLKNDARSQTYQLMSYDGNRSDVPLVDNVVGLRFEYLGDPQPPMLRKAVSDPAGPWTTYGPKPPMLGADAGLGYPVGENCAFQVLDGRHAPRLADLSPGSTRLVPLPAAMLTDGPWCPSPTSPARFDADLLRIRQVRVTLRVQAAARMLRGTGALFAHGGYAKGGEMWVPDQELRFDVSPRNLNLGR